MIRILAPCAVMLAICSPPASDTAMHRTQDQAPADILGHSKPSLGSQIGPGAQPVSAAASPAPLSDSPRVAQGRRTLSTAFVAAGPDRLIHVTLRDGRELVLRDVVMRRDYYCGAQVSGERTGKRHCGGYAEILAARTGGQPAIETPDLARTTPLGSERQSGDAE